LRARCRIGEQAASFAAADTERSSSSASISSMRAFTSLIAAVISRTG